MHVSEVFRSLLQDGNSGEWMYQTAYAADFGRIGVVAFFAVSGFVIPASFSHQGWFGLKIFWLRRFFRLYPAFWLSIPLAIVSTWTLWDKPVSLMQVMANITLLPSLFHQLPLQGLYWTLQVEILFYVIFSILFLMNLFNKVKPIAGITGLFFIIFLFATFQGLITSTTLISSPVKTVSLYLSIMFWGALYRFWHDKKTKDIYGIFVLWTLPSTMIILTILALLLINTKYSDKILEVRFMVSHTLGCILFLTFAQLRNIQFRPLVILGEISYALYLFHPIVFFPIYWWAGRPSSAWIRAMPLEFWVVSMGLSSVLAAYLVHHWVELPAIRKGKEITQRMTASVA